MAARTETPPSEGLGDAGSTGPTTVVKESSAPANSDTGSSPKPAGLSSWFAELRRRRVFRALVGYGIASFAVLQVIEPIMHGAHWPEIVLSYVVAALAAGFPIVITLAWAFDVKAGRIERTAPAAAAGLKGIRLALLLVGIGVLAAAPGLIWYFFIRGGARTAAVPAPVASVQAVPSIAVLPFADLSPSKDQEYFSDGIAEEILTALAQVDGLRVAGRTSSFYFKGKNEDLAVIADKLHVATLLEGSVRKSGNRVRITAQLINARDGFHLWSKQYDRELTDIFKVQGELALAVVDALKVKLLSGAAAAPRVHEARDPEAHRLFLLGRSQSFQATAESLAQAAANLAKAVAIDPAYAPAWQLLSTVHVSLALNAPRSEIPRRAQEALAEVDRAIAIDGDFAEALASRGWIRGWLFWDWPGAKADLQRALQLNPHSPDALNSYAGFMQKAGRLSEAIALQRKAAELDPLDADNWTNLGAFLMDDGQLGPAREAFFRSQEISPHHLWAADLLVLLDLLEGHPAKALEAAGKLPDSPFRLLNIAVAQHDLGRARESAAALDALVAKVPSDEPDVAYYVAAVHAWRGERDQAFEWLETAYKRRELRLRLLRVEPYFRSLRGDPRLLALLKKMNLPLD